MPRTHRIGGLAAVVIDAKPNSPCHIVFVQGQIISQAIVVIGNFTRNIAQFRNASSSFNQTLNKSQKAILIDYVVIEHFLKLRVLKTEYANYFHSPTFCENYPTN